MLAFVHHYSSFRTKHHWCLARIGRKSAITMFRKRKYDSLVVRKMWRKPREMTEEVLMTTFLLRHQYLSVHSHHELDHTNRTQAHHTTASSEMATFEHTTKVGVSPEVKHE